MERDFSLRSDKNGFGAHTMGTDRSFLGENSRSVKVTIHLHLVVRSRMSTPIYIFLQGVVLN